eukprot:950075-Rhodomonas_salina.1
MSDGRSNLTPHRPLSPIAHRMPHPPDAMFTCAIFRDFNTASSDSARVGVSGKAPELAESRRVIEDTAARKLPFFPKEGVQPGGDRQNRRQLWQML